MPEPRWLSDREQRTWRGYIQMSKRLATRLSREMQASTGLSEADFEVLVNLSEAPELRMRAFALGGALEWEKSRLSHHLTRMESRGLVRRRECSNDARGAFVEITSQGLSAIEAAAPQHVEAVRRYLIDRLTPEQLDALDGITDSVLERLGEASPTCRSEPEAE